MLLSPPPDPTVFVEFEIDQKHLADPVERD
jgi:hypothetical protein